jgi:FAD/FMN-containing dehydrogenase
MNGITPTSLEELQSAVTDHARIGRHLHYARPWRASVSNATNGTSEQAAGSRAEDSTPVDLSAWNGVIDYPHRDMTITVQTGITLEELRVCLAEQNQWLPVDVPWPERMRVADLILDHWYGSFSAGHGTIRDWLLGITAIDGAGRVFHAGGRVVKNVAGYDLCKLLVGSAGALGLPLEAATKYDGLLVRRSLQATD